MSITFGLFSILLILKTYSKIDNLLDLIRYIGTRFQNILKKSRHLNDINKIVIFNKYHREFFKEINKMC